MVGPAAVAQDREQEARALRRLVRSFHSTDRYGLVLLMIVATYVLAAALTQTWSATIVLVAQIGAVGLALRASRASRGLRLVAMGLFVLAIAAAVASLFIDRDSDLVAVVFLTATVLYIVAPVAIVRHIGYRREVDQETMLGALCAYLLIGQLRHPHDARLRQPCPGPQPRPEPRCARGPPRPAVPRHRDRQGGERLATQGLATVCRGRTGCLREVGRVKLTGCVPRGPAARRC
jgi:hypothetical protein